MVGRSGRLFDDEDVAVVGRQRSRSLDDKFDDGERPDIDDRVDVAVDGRDMAVDGRDKRSIVAVAAADVGRNIGLFGDSKRFDSGETSCFSKCRNLRTTVFRLHR